MMSNSTVLLFRNHLRKIFWKLPLSNESKEKFLTSARVLKRKLTKANAPQPSKNVQSNILSRYVQQVLATPKAISDHFVSIDDRSYARNEVDPKLIAYYLPQFHPTKENDAWWGLGVTEWNNVSRAAPQFVGHYQPRLPGELGYYDLRIEDNLVRQTELAQKYGIHGFAFYYYWFDGKRLLDKPLDMFAESQRINFPFCLCWANESWTRRFDGSCGEILVKQSETKESYLSFIESTLQYMKNEKYIKVDGRPVLIIYRPSLVPDCVDTLIQWRKKCVDAKLGSPYIIGVKESTWLHQDLLSLGFDAQSEFHPGTLFHQCTEVGADMEYVRKDFGGLVLDYSDIVLNKKYFNYNFEKMYRAIMPMWDNTARRDNKGMIFHGATPVLYEKWLRDLIADKNAFKDLPEKFIFVNAWNEWGEGAYLEPDKYFGYAYLNATRTAIEESR